MKKVRVAILGGGIAGTVIARQLANSGKYEIDLFEKAPILGGIHRSVELGGLNYDAGTFVFPMDTPIFKAFPEVKPLFERTNFTPDVVRRPGRIDRYPMTLKGYIRDFGRRRTFIDLFQAVLGKPFRFRKKTLVEYVQYYLGSGIYTRSGLKAYIERLYQMDDRSIDLEFAVQRLQYLKIFEMRGGPQSAYRRLFSAKHESSDSHPCLVRPKGGFGLVYGTMEDILSGLGVRVLTRSEIESISVSGTGFEIDSTPYDRIVSTIPIPSLSKCLDIKVEARFESVDLVTLFYRFRGKTASRAAVLFNYSQVGQWKRITIFSRYYGQEEGEDYFSVECILKHGDERGIDFLKADFESHVFAYGLFHGELTFQGSITTQNAYPIFHAGEMEKIQRSKTAIQALGVDLAGRQGAFEYLSSEQTAAAAIRFAESMVMEPGENRTPVRSGSSYSSW